MLYIIEIASGHVSSSEKENSLFLAFFIFIFDFLWYYISYQMISIHIRSGMDMQMDHQRITNSLPRTRNTGIPEQCNIFSLIYKQTRSLTRLYRLQQSHTKGIFCGISHFWTK